MDDAASLEARLSCADLRNVDLARMLGVQKSTVTYWCQNGVPAHRRADVETLLNTTPHQEVKVMKPGNHYNATSIWWGMTDAQRVAYIQERIDMTYRQIANEVGIAESTVGDFSRLHNLGKYAKDAQRRAKRWAQLADKIAPLYAQGLTSQEIRVRLGLSYSYVDNIIQVARQSGDKRFPLRKKGRKPGSQPAKIEVMPEASLVEIYHAFKREVHPDGTPYTMECVFNAHSGKGHTFKQPRIRSHASKRDIANLAQLARATPLISADGQLA